MPQLFSSGNPKTCKNPIFFSEPSVGGAVSLACDAQSSAGAAGGAEVSGKLFQGASLQTRGACVASQLALCPGLVSLMDVTYTLLVTFIMCSVTFSFV